jgi:hypothetical protein
MLKYLKSIFDYLYNELVKLIDLLGQKTYEIEDEDSYYNNDVLEQMSRYKVM